MEILIGLSVLCVVFAIFGAVLDYLDPFGERRDARRRNGR